MSRDKLFCTTPCAPFSHSVYCDITTLSLYPTCAWDDKQIRRLIGDGKLAARCKGTEVRVQVTDTECPICFLNYPAVNQTKCCQASICTECYLQVRPPKEKRVACPFCNTPALMVTPQQTLSADAIQEREAEEQRAMQASIRARTASADKNNPEEQAPGFGSSLENNSHVALMRKRSSSLSSDVAIGVAVDEVGSPLNNSGHGNNPDLTSVAMTAEERQALEAELRAQQNSPLIQRIQQEEMERAFRNQREYQQQNAGRYYRRRRDWARLIQAFEEQGNGSGARSLDDLGMLEAAMRLAAHEQAATGNSAGNPLRRRMLDRRSDAAAADFLGGPPAAASAVAAQLMLTGMSEEEQIAMAIAASLQDANNNRAENSADANNEENNNNDDGNDNEEETTVVEALAPDGSNVNASNTETDGALDAVTQPLPGEEEDFAETLPVREQTSSGPVDLDVSLSETDAAVTESVPPLEGNVVEEPTSEPPLVNAVEETDGVRASSSEEIPQTELVREDVQAQALTASTSSTEPIVAQTGLPVSEVLQGDAQTIPSQPGNQVADVVTPVESEEADQPSTTEAELELDEIKSTEELKLPDDAVSAVASESSAVLSPTNDGDEAIEAVEA